MSKKTLLLLETMTNHNSRKVSQWVKVLHSESENCYFKSKWMLDLHQVSSLVTGYPLKYPKGAI